MRSKLKLLAVLSAIVAASGSLAFSAQSAEAKTATVLNPCPNTQCIDGGACTYLGNGKCLQGVGGACKNSSC